jgi:hypothetical protein
MNMEFKLVDLQRSSRYTKQIAEADKRRNKATVGISLTVAANLRHFNPDVAESARAIKIRLKSFNSYIETKPYTEKSSAIQILVKDLKENFAEQIHTLHLNEWINELSDAQNQFDSLFDMRNEERAEFPTEKIAAVRKKSDKLYRKMVAILEAYALLNGKDDTTDFIKELNAEIDYFNLHIKHEKKENIAAATVADIPDKIYDGRPVVPTPVVSHNNEQLTFTEDFSLSYHNNDKPGTALIRINGKGRYKGHKLVSFNIISADKAETKGNF